jgi:AbrB family looped-hinge helix DNA binding protein
MKGGEGMRITQKGQVTIPQDIREKAGLLPYTEVEFVLENDRVYLRKKEGQGARSKSLIDRMRGKGSVRMSTDQILTLTRE